jgi:ribosomal protein L29
MKKNQEKQKLQQMNIADLKEHLENTRRELFNVRLNAISAHVKDYSQFKKLRASIACTLTLIQQHNARARNDDVQTK